MTDLSALAALAAGAPAVRGSSGVSRLGRSEGSCRKDRDPICSALFKNERGCCLLRLDSSAAKPAQGEAEGLRFILSYIAQVAPGKRDVVRESFETGARYGMSFVEIKEAQDAAQESAFQRGVEVEKAGGTEIQLISTKLRLSNSSTQRVSEILAETHQGSFRPVRQFECKRSGKR